MRTKIYFTLLSLMLVNFCMAQDKPKADIKKQTEKAVQTSKELSKDLKKIRDVLNDAIKDSNDCVGQLCLKKTIHYYDKGDDSPKDSCIIVNSRVRQEEGFLYVTILAIIKDPASNKDVEYHFVNGKPIALSSLRKTHWPNALYVTDRKTSPYFIYFEDAFFYDEMSRFIPEACDEIITADTCLAFNQNLNLDNHIRLNTYTDLLSTLGDAKNGLVQTQLALPFTANNHNFKNTRMVPFRSVTPSFTFQKFDSKNAVMYLTKKDTQNFSITNRLDDIQKSAFNLDLQLNLIDWYNGPGSRVSGQLNGIVNTGLFKTALIDSTLSAVNDSTIIHTLDTTDLGLKAHIMIGFGGNLHLRQSKFLTIDIGTRLIWDKVAAPDIVNRGFIAYINPTLQVSWMPKRAGAGNIFFRYTGFFTAKEPITSFSQFLVGYSASITSLFGG